ncbi:MAG: Sensor kinase CckA [Halieaceae bacterium]|nr:MAG: Sensor kinase CckA [Halieaceae bacterium]
MASKGIAVQNRIDEATWVMGNTIQFEQVMINMMNNARDAITERSTTGAITLTQTVSDGFVTIAIEDTGGGIPHEVLPHIFEPFFTTKPVGKGTGLGGSISYGIIQDMQGDIWAENTKDGAKISIRLPVHEGSVKTSSEEAR